MREILLGLVKPDPESSTTTDEELAICLGKLLSGRRYLIVLDDMRDEEVWLSLKNIFLEDKNGSRIIVTARQLFVHENGPFYDYSNIVRFLNEDESWELLCCAAIGEGEMCPTQLVKLGRIISHDCEGLPLKVITLGSLLSRLPQDPEAWSELADDREKQNMEMLKVTQDLRNEFMPQIVKTCFLYILAFPQYQRIAPPQLFKLWTAEGFILLGDHPDGEVESTFFDLIQRNLVMVHAWSSMNAIKTCSIHSAIWPFYHREAMDNKVFQSIKSWKDEACPSHRRFSIHKNVLLAIKDVYDSIASVSNARSLLCSGPYHPYPLLRVNFKSFRLLKVLDALSIRFYIFPFEIVKLVLLRFVALTLCKGELPTSVSNLEQLEFLIVRLHSSIKSSGTPCFLPMEIWNMKELMHLQVMGSDLPSPPPYDDNVCLPNLITLLDVSPLSCTKEVFERVPNLKKLGVVAELPWDEARAAEAPPLHVFNLLVHLEHLESFKYYLRNPILSPVPPYSHFVFPRRLDKLTLSGCALSWENMKEVARLPNLIVLKLRCHAFRGPKWEMDDQDKFEMLRVLVLEDLDLEQWTAEDYSFPVLHCLVVSHCYKLKTIPSQIINGEMIEQIELADCSPSVVDFAAVEQQERGNERLQVTIYSFWT